MTGRLSRVLRRRRVQVAVAIVALGGAVTAVAVANFALLDVAGGAQNQVGGLSSRLDLAPPSAPVTATPATPATPVVTTPAPAPPPSPPVSTARDDDHGGVDADHGGVDADHAEGAGEAGDD